MLGQGCAICMQAQGDSAREQLWLQDRVVSELRKMIHRPPKGRACPLVASELLHPKIVRIGHALREDFQWANHRMRLYFPTLQRNVDPLDLWTSFGPAQDGAKITMRMLFVYHILVLNIFCFCCCVFTFYKK